MAASNLDHLKGELDRIDHLVFTLFDGWKAQNAGTDPDLLGLCITDHEIESIINRQNLVRNTEVHDEGNVRTGVPEEDNAQDALQRAGIIPGCSRLTRLAELFQLSETEVDILLVCLALEFDLKYEKIYAYLQNDVTKKNPTVDLVMKILFPGNDRRLPAWDLFSSESSLIYYRLIRFIKPDPQAEIPLLQRALKVDERIIRYILGSDVCDEKLVGWCNVCMPARSFEDFLTEAGDPDNPVLTMKRLSCENNPAIMYLSGPAGTGKKHLVEAICRDLSRKILTVDSRGIDNEKKEEMLLLILREAIIQESAVFFTYFDNLLEEENAGVLIYLFNAFDKFPGWIFISATKSYEPPVTSQNHRFFLQELHTPSYELRKRLWLQYLDGLSTVDADIPALATSFRFSGGQIINAIGHATGYAQRKWHGSVILAMEDFLYGCKAQSNRNLSGLAKRTKSRYRWDDIVLPPDTKLQLHEICDCIRSRGQVYTEWGFERKLSLGKGLNILFTGPSGTGKTMAADVIATEAGLDMYKIDLSSVVSKFIGETEKNLHKIFLEAETSNAILFFDEADALFGKRTEVRDAHDRYANIEINYLLQKMEESEGVIILASNFPRNIDEAFRRRMHFAVEFSQPDRDLREAIWRAIFPQEVPVDELLDYPFMSKFKISGGNIKNIVVNAAFFASADEGIVTMKHIVRAIKREFQKMGKLYSKEEFEPYYHLVERGEK